jgi:hypothetical protein
MLLALAFALVLLACFSIFLFFYLQIKGNKRLKTGKPDLTSSLDLGVCARCQQKRTIVKKEEGLCAFCWSSLNTKQVG